MSCGLGGDMAARRQHDEEEEDEELFETSSGGESGDEEDQFPGSGGEDQFPGSGGEDRRSALLPPPVPLRRMNSDSIYDMSGMTAHLPAKKGLSMYYQGKSQSFACMSEVRCLEDLQKKEKPPRGHKMKCCKSYAALGGSTTANNNPASSCGNLNLMAANGFGAAPRIPVNNRGYHQ